MRGWGGRRSREGAGLRCLGVKGASVGIARVMSLTAVVALLSVSHSLSLCLSLYPCLCLSVSPSVCLSQCLSVCLSVSPPPPPVKVSLPDRHSCLNLYSCVMNSRSQSVSQSLSICVSILSVSVSVCLCEAVSLRLCMCVRVRECLFMVCLWPQFRLNLK